MQIQYQVIERKLVQTQDENGLLTIFVNPNETERKFLIETLKLDEHTLSSALDPDELSRLEFEPEHVAIILKRPKNYSGNEQFVLKIGSLGAYLFKERLVIVTDDDAPLFNGYQFNKPITPIGLLLKLIYRSIVHFREHLKVINAIANELQHEINTSMSNRHLIHLFELEKSLVYYMNFINSNGFMIEKLKASSTKLGFSIDEIETLDDIIIENNQCSKQAEIYSNILAGLMDARASIVSNNINVLMKTLNLITIVIMIPTLVVSIFSMNVHIPLAGNPNAFWIINGFSLFMVFTVMILWIYKKW